jgi:small-conductance mechanosensitive channel
MERLFEALPSMATIAIVVAALIVVKRVLDRAEGRLKGHQFRHQMIMLVLTGIGVVAVILVIPIGDTMRGQVLSLVGVLLSAAIALSSTTVLGNAMAGIMLRTVRNFRMGDFILVGEHFGRVTERGLFHTEIQNEHRELTVLPNLYLVTHPVTTTRKSGTIVSASVSLGYDLQRTRIKELLHQAASKAELSDPFVHVMELGDFSVTYRVAGLLTEVKRLVSVRSRLRECVLDSLHENGVEIVSPNFMNTRALSPGAVVIPEQKSQKVEAEVESESSPEATVFDKADEAETIENLRLSCAKLTEEIGAQEDRVKKTPEGAEREKAQRELSVLQRRKQKLEQVISDRERASAEPT